MNTNDTAESRKIRKAILSSKKQRNNNYSSNENTPTLASTSFNSTVYGITSNTPFNLSTRKSRSPFADITNVSQLQSASAIFSCSTSLQSTEARRKRKEIINNKRQHKSVVSANVSSFKHVTYTSSIPLSGTSIGPSTLLDDFSNQPSSSRLFRSNSNNPTESPWTCQSPSPCAPSVTNKIPKLVSQVVATTPLYDISNHPSSSRGFRRNSQNATDKSSKPKQKRICRNLRKSNLPVLALTFEDDEDNMENRKKYYGISEDYFDIGDPTYTCKACNAMLWKAEHQRGVRGKHTPGTYSICCKYGKVQLPNPQTPPQYLLNLFQNDDSKSKYFRENIRRFNMMFSFTSLGGKIDHAINNGRGPYCFRLHGQNYHSIGSLLPGSGEKPKFSQLYIVDTENEVSNRLNSFRNNRDETQSASLESEIADELKQLLDDLNPLVKSYRMVRDRCHTLEEQNIRLKLIGRRATDGRTYNLPTASEVAALIVGDIDPTFDKRDIVVEVKNGRLQRINELHPSYLALQYPLLFPRGEDGYRVGIAHRGVRDTGSKKRSTLTMREFFAFLIQHRTDQVSLLLIARKLFQQFLVDAYTMIESQRLWFLRSQQKKLRISPANKLAKAVDEGQSDASQLGNRVVLPSTFTGGSRYMMQNYMDAMTLCKWFGYPDLFLTFTCNPKWPEMLRFCDKYNVKPEDKPEIMSRIFKIKLDQLLSDLKDKSIFGKVKAVVYTIEFQKRGLPHCHICLFLDSDSKLRTPDDIDRIISAEIPNKEDDPKLYELVTDLMMHGPCGENNPKCPCMRDGKCSKNFPKNFTEFTSVDADGFPVYRRRNNGNVVKKGDIELDNRHVVGYNTLLIKRYQAHINVEWCNQLGSIKYLFKYITKGPDRISVTFSEESNGNNEDENDKGKDEIEYYYQCRYISASESSWRIFTFDIHYRTPSVVRLSFHLPGEESIVYDGSEDVDDVLNKPSVGNSMFLEWMECNKKFPQARLLTYAEFPTKFVWNIKLRKWTPRNPSSFAVGRLHYVPISAGEAYFLRILLNIVKGVTSFEDIRTVDGKVYESYKKACFALGLLDDDKEYIDGIKEAATWGSASYCRSLFVMLLTSNTLSRPEFVWEQTWPQLSEDLSYKQQKKLRVSGMNLDDEAVKNMALAEIETLMLSNGTSLKRIPDMPFPDYEYLSVSQNMLIQQELDYHVPSLIREHESLFPTLNAEQREVYQKVLSSVDKDEGGVFFVYGYGGTGKTFLWKTLAAAIRSRGEIVVNVASSGIASLLLTGGRTAHSRFGIPINLNEDSFCNISPDSDLAALLRKSKLIIWDEAPMMHRHCFESLDRSLRDIIPSNAYHGNEKPFGGKVVVFGGDFRQILPVIPGGSRQDIVNASLNSSYIWEHCTVLKLKVNMRLQFGCPSAELDATKQFAEWILKIGDGVIGESNDGEGIVEIPDEILIHDTENPISSIVSTIYPSFEEHLNEPSYFQDRAILVPTNEEVDCINDYMMNELSGEAKVYLSSDSICQTELGGNFHPSLYTPDVLNGIKVSGLPHHKLTLKVGVPIMLLRNIDQPNGLCNGTRLQVLKLGQHVIEAKIISGTNVGKITLIPRMKLIPSDKRIPFRLQRRQFPIVVCFAMTINKSQGQSLSQVGLFLQRPVFTHGQLYVAISRVKSKHGLKVFICDKDGKPTNTTTNVVYKEVLQKL